jgi:hypothetical protein
MSILRLRCAKPPDAFFPFNSGKDRYRMSRDEDRRSGPLRSQAAEDLRRVSTNNPVSIVLIAVVVLLALGVGVSEIGGGGEESVDGGGEESVDEAPMAETGASDPDVGDPFVERCVDSWNRTSDQGKRGTSSFGQAGRVYASVYPSADFPDQCLVTVTVSAGGGPIVQQWSENRPGLWVPGGGPPLDALSPETKDWNVTANPDGTLSYF